jgi:hypothetical protein
MPLSEPQRQQLENWMRSQAISSALLAGMLSGNSPKPPTSGHFWSRAILTWPRTKGW